MPDDPVQQQAIRWAVRASQPEMDAEQQAALDAWLAADRRHRGAFLRARAGLKIMDRALTRDEPHDRSVNDNEKDESTGRRLLARWPGRVALGSVCLAAGLSLFLVDVSKMSPSAKPQPTGIAQRAPEKLKLEDGSIVTLGRNGRIEIAMSDQTRRIRLMSGEASFAVAKDPARPFVVQSGSVYAQATGTRYSVRRQGDTGGAIAVAEGSVLVWARDEREQAVLLHAGDKLALEPTRVSQPSAQHPLPPPAIAKISLDNVPIAAAVARFNRVNSTQIVIADPEIGAIRIVGLFKANDPERFAQTVADFAGAKVTHANGEIVIKMN